MSVCWTTEFPSQMSMLCNLSLGDVLLLTVNNFYNRNDETFLGFYPPNNGERIGFDIAKLAIAALALWFIYRGVFPNRWAKKSN